MDNFWIARYSDNGPDNFDWHLWQRTNKGILEGYDAGRVDINLFRGCRLINSSLKFEIKAKQFYAASQRVL